MQAVYLNWRGGFNASMNDAYNRVSNAAVRCSTANCGSLAGFILGREIAAPFLQRYLNPVGDETYRVIPAGQDEQLQQLF